MRCAPVLVLVTSILILWGCADKNERSVEWSFQTGGELLSHPVIHDNTLYFGSNDSAFYAIDTRTQKTRWVYKSGSPIKCQAIIENQIVYFFNAQTVHALDAQTGNEIWRFDYSPESTGEPLDPWDYHYGTPVIVGERIYCGLADGNLYGLDLGSGEKVDQFAVIDSAAIRCSPASRGKYLYFGDWNGIVYAYDTELRDTLWTYATYTERLYETFGQLNTTFTVYDDLLLFGGRNPQLQILDIKTGIPVWDYTSDDGGWISGDPLVLNDTLYIGGSDNHKLFAFDVRNGTPLWEFEFLYNNFCQPVFADDQILFTTGDANNVYRGDDGRGYLYGVSRSSGELRNFTLFDANVFSTPVLDERSIYVASVDSSIYALDKLEFLRQGHDLADRGYYAVELLETSIPSFRDSVSVNYRVNFQTHLEITMYDLAGTPLMHWPGRTFSLGDQILNWDGADERGNPVDPGYYYFEFKAQQFYQSVYVQKLE